MDIQYPCIQPAWTSHIHPPSQPFEEEGYTYKTVKFYDIVEKYGRCNRIAMHYIHSIIDISKEDVFVSKFQMQANYVPLQNMERCIHFIPFSIC